MLLLLLRMCNSSQFIRGASTLDVGYLFGMVLWTTTTTTKTIWWKNYKTLVERIELLCLQYECFATDIFALMNTIKCKRAPEKMWIVERNKSKLTNILRYNHIKKANKLDSSIQSVMQTHYFVDDDIFGVTE